MSAHACRIVAFLGLALTACVTSGCASASGPRVDVAALADVDTVAGWTTYLVMPDEDADLNAYGRAVRRHLEREGHRVVTSDEEPWDVYVKYGYESQGWTLTTTNRRYGYSTTSHYTDVKTFVGFVERAEVARLDGDTRLADMAWKGTHSTRVHGDAFRISDHVDRLVTEILDEFIAWKHPPEPELELGADPEALAAASGS